MILAVTAGAFLLAGFVKGVIGLGLPTVSIGLLGLLMVPAQAAAILVVPSLVTNIWQAVVGGGLIALARRLWPMLVGICLGTFVGAVLLPHDATGQATIWLGVALALYAALGLLNVHFKVPQRAETWLGLVMGAATGASRSRPASLSCRGRHTSKPCSSNATNWCRHLVYRLPFQQSHSLWRSHTRDKYTRR